MSRALKCPNPSCPYLFDPTTVPPGVVLACPRCGMRFTLGTPGAPPPGAPGAGANDPTNTFPGSPPGFPAAGGYPTAASAQPSYAPAPPNPVEAAFGEMTPETAKADGEEGPRLPIRESKLQTILLIAVGAIALTAAGVAVWSHLSATREPDARSQEITKYKDVNFSLESPAKPWAPDSETKSKLDAPFIAVFKRENPEAFMAFGARDFKDHEPRPKELRDILIQALDKLIEPDTRKEFGNDIEEEWMGRGVQGFKFSGLLKGGGASVEGEAMAVSYKGIGYWFLSWTGSNEIFLEQKPTFAVARAGCKLLDHREKWKPKFEGPAPYKNTSIGYSFFDSEHVWIEFADESDIRGQDSKADKYLAAYEDPTKRNKVFRARLVVALLDVVSDNPLNDARVHVEAHVNELAESQGKWVFKEYTEPPEGDPTNPAEGNTPYVLLKVVSERDPSNAHLYAVSGVRVGAKTVALYAWCPWRDRASFDTKFIQVAKSLRSDK